MPSMASVWRTGRCEASTVRMISSFSDAGYLMPRTPHPRSCFFQQAVFQGQVGHGLLQRRRLGTQLLDLGRGRLTSRIAGQPLFARFKELLRPRVVKALADPLAAAQRGDALLTAQTSQHDPDLFISRVLLPGLALDPFDQLVGRVLRCSGFLVHLRSLVAAMNQKSSVTKTSNLSHRC